MSNSSTWCACCYGQWRQYSIKRSRASFCRHAWGSTIGGISAYSIQSKCCMNALFMDSSVLTIPLLVLPLTWSLMQSCWRLQGLNMPLTRCVLRREAWRQTWRAGCTASWTSLPMCLHCQPAPGTVRRRLPRNSSGWRWPIWERL